MSSRNLPVQMVRQRRLYQIGIRCLAATGQKVMANKKRAGGAFLLNLYH